MVCERKKCDTVTLAIYPEDGCFPVLMMNFCPLRFLSAALLAAPCMFPFQAQHDYPIKPVPFTQVHVTDQYWAPRIETNRKVSIPTAFEQCERTGRIENFVRAARAIHGQEL